MRCIGNNVLVEQVESQSQGLITQTEVHYHVVAVGDKVDCVEVGDQVIVNEHALKGLPGVPVYSIADIQILAKYTK